MGDGGMSLKFDFLWSFSIIRRKVPHLLSRDHHLRKPITHTYSYLLLLLSHIFYYLFQIRIDFWRS